MDRTIEAQWKDLVAKLAASGNFSRTQAVVDVSGSMQGTPMQVAIALGLIIAELTSEPFKNQLITFHEQPKLHRVTGSSLKERVFNVSQMPWGGSTDFLAVFKLHQAHSGAEMVEKLFVFSDMQFNAAGGLRKWAPN